MLVDNTLERRGIIVGVGDAGYKAGIPVYEVTDSHQSAVCRHSTVTSMAGREICFNGKAVQLVKLCPLLVMDPASEVSVGRLAATRCTLPPPAPGPPQHTRITDSTAPDTPLLFAVWVHLVI